MAIKVQCPGCKKIFSVPDSYHHKAVKCSKCATEFRALQLDETRQSQRKAPGRATVDTAGESSPVDSSSPAGKVGEQFGRYRLLGELGHGGMGIVYKAFDPELKRTVALKMLLDEESGVEREQVDRFIREARAAAKLRHPNIVQIYDFGEKDAKHYFTMEYVDGISLADALADKERYGISSERICEIVRDVADALHYAYSQGIVHRDIKPANILLGEEGRPCLTDFGLAKEVKGLDKSLTLTGAVMGTPWYMSPEQANGENKIDGRSDIFSLGAVMYEALTGCKPFDGTQMYEILSKVINTDPVRPASISRLVHRDMETICMKCLEKEKRRRYQSAKKLSDDITRHLKGEPILARPAGLASRVWKKVRENKFAFAGACAAAVILLVVVISMIVSSARVAGKVETYIEQAQEEFENKNYAESRALCEKILELSPENVAARQLRQKCIAVTAKLDKESRREREAAQAEAQKERREKEAAQLSAAELARKMADAERDREKLEEERAQLKERLAEVQRLEQARLAEEALMRELREKADRSRAAEEARVWAQKSRLAAEERRREEERKREEELARKKEEKPEPPEKPKGDAPVAGESKVPWDEVKLSPGTAAPFPYPTPRPCLMPLQRAAVGKKLLIPLPHKGKVSGFLVEDRGTVITVDTNADGRPDKRLPRNGGVVVLKISYEAGKERPYAVEIKRHSGTLKYTSCGWMAGKYKGTRIAIIDENSNGKYNDYVSFDKKKIIREYRDAVVVGRASGAAALGNIIVIKDKFYEIKVEEDGSRLHIRLHEAPAGKLSLREGFKAHGILTYATVLGQLHGSRLVVSVELSSARKPVTVPAGEYFIFAGKVTSPRRKDRKVYIGVAAKTKNFKVGEDETVVPRWGAPGTIDFEYVLGKSGDLQINPYRIRLFGKLGEEYKYWTPMEFVPRVQVQTAAGKKVADELIEYTADFKKFYTFKKNLRAGQKYKVRIVGEPCFLGKSESKWK